MQTIISRLQQVNIFGLLIRLARNIEKGALEIEGHEIALIIPESEETVTFFFTKDHATYWLYMVEKSEK